MSASLFHRRFHQIPGTAPLQFHKRPRLLPARRPMPEEDRGVTEAAFATGCESLSHFSRDYRRQFGHAPRNARDPG